MKAFTDLDQSKKLTVILPLETADMHYVLIDTDENKYDAGLGKYIGILPYYPCWSLAALFDIIPKRIKDYNVLRIDINENDTAIWYDKIGCGVNNDLPDVTKESAIDSCYEMIIKLNELNLL